MASLTKKRGDPGDGTGAPMADRMPNIAPSLFVLPTLLRSAYCGLIQNRNLSYTMSDAEDPCQDWFLWAGDRGVDKRG